MTKNTILTRRGYIALAVILVMMLIAGCRQVPAEKTTQVPYVTGNATGIFGMKIEQLVGYDNRIEVVTTGARFVLQNDGTLRSWQRIPIEREVMRLALPKETWPFSVVKEDDFDYDLSGNGIILTFHGDSSVILKTERELDITFSGLFKPAYHAELEGKWLFIDPEGGFGVYPVATKQTDTPDFTTGRWNIKYHLETGEELWFSVFPPRPYNRERASKPLAHVGSPESPYPDEELIRSAAKYNKIFNVHSYIWPGGSAEPWLIPEFVPTDMQEFIRVRDEVHENGMKFVVYFSPFYSTAPDFFTEVRRALDQYGVDGLYFDGVSTDFRKSYYIVRKTRQVLGDDRILYMHSSTDPFNSIAMYAPFIDTYADYMLRGEAGRYGFELDDFLRWTLSCYNISNAVGYWCYEDSAETDASGGYKQVDYAPKSEHIDAALRNHVYLWWRDTWQTEDRERFEKEYYSKLKQLQQEAP